MIKQKIADIVFEIIFRIFLKKMFKQHPGLGVVPQKDPDSKGEVQELKPTLPAEGGIKTYFPNLKYPFPGFPDNRIVKKVALAKRIIPFGIKWIHKQIEPFIPKNPNLYSKPVREIYRLFSIAVDRDTRANVKGKMSKLRDIACVFAEYDDAYRFIFQDVAPEAKLKEFELTDADKWWFMKKLYNFKGKEEFRKKVEKEDNAIKI